MKTVWDAVNELKGDFNLDGLGTEEHFNQVICTNCAFDGYSSGFVTTGSGVKGNQYWAVICTKEEFNELVDEMEANFYEYNMNGVTNYQIALAEGKATKLEVESKVDKPVYTQEMHDKGELVKKGMLFTTEVDGNYTARLVNTKSVCFIDEDGFFVGIPICTAKPIDNRSDKEKAIDDIKKVIADTPYKTDEQSIKFFELIKAGKIHGVTWSKGNE